MARQLDTARHAANGPRKAAGYDWEGAMAASLAGDSAAYRRLLEEAGRWLRRYFARRLASELIDDAVQEALTALHLKRATFEPGRPFLPWLAAIARFKGVDCMRSAGRHRTEEFDETLHGVPSHESASLSGIVMAGLFERLRRPQADAIRQSDGFFSPDLIAAACGPNGAGQLPVKAALAQIFATKTRADWEEWAKGRDLCFAPVLDLKEAFAQPQITQRGMLLHDESGNPHIGTPVHYADEPGRPDLRLPALGEHTAQILHRKTPAA